MWFSKIIQFLNPLNKNQGRFFTTNLLRQIQSFIGIICEVHYLVYIRESFQLQASILSDIRMTVRIIGRSGRGLF